MSSKKFEYYWRAIFDQFPYNPIEFQTYRYDQSISLPEKLNKLYDMFEELALNNQEIMDYLKQFVETFDKTLYDSVYDILQHWYDDGLFETLIDEITVKQGDLSIFREFDKTVMEKLKNESYERGINVRWFGAKIDGVTDDSNALQQAINYCAKNVLNPTISNVVLLPKGNYILGKSVIIPPYIKVKSLGNVYINPTKDFMMDTPLLWIKWFNDDRDPQEFKGNSYPNYRIQQFEHDYILDGSNGNIALTGLNVHMTALDNQYDNPDGLWIGNIEKLGPNQVVARTYFKNLMLSNLNRAIAISKHDTFILTFSNIHIERCYVCVDDHLLNEVSGNNGENTVFNTCIFSNSHIVFRKDMFTSCYGCSFDFNVCICYSENGYAGMSHNIFGGHIEGTGSIVKANSISYNVNIFGTRIYLKNRNEYDRLFIGTATVNLENIYWSGTTTKEIYQIVTGSYFLADFSIVLKYSTSFFANSLQNMRPIFNKRTNLFPHTESGVLKPSFDGRTSMVAEFIDTGDKLFKSLDINKTIQVRTQTVNESPTGWFTFTTPEYNLKGERELFLDGVVRLRVPNNDRVYHNYTYKFVNKKGEKTEIKKYGQEFKLDDIENDVRFDSAICQVPQDAISVTIEIGFPYTTANQQGFYYELGGLFLNGNRF